MWVYILIAECGAGVTFPIKVSATWAGIMWNLSDLKEKGIKCGYDVEHDDIPQEEPEKPDSGLLDSECNLGSVRYDRFEDGKIEYVLWREWMEV